jgi:hypothetical protein
MSWMIGVLGFDCRRGLRIFLFTTASRTALEPNQTPIQWVRGFLSLGIKRPGSEADHSPPSSAEVKECVELYLHFSNTPSRRGAALKRRAQGQIYLDLYVFIFEFIDRRRKTKDSGFYASKHSLYPVSSSSRIKCGFVTVFPKYKKH